MGALALNFRANPADDAFKMARGDADAAAALVLDMFQRMCANDEAETSKATAVNETE
jgi:hypothetical protein